MDILVTNDDGYQAKGIHSLVSIMKQFGRVSVVAPKHHQSGMGMAVSIGARPIAYKDLGEEDGVRWAYLDATPASCTKFGLNFPTFGKLPDVLVSGINHGSNASSAGCYSGTLGAAAEAAVFGLPAIGVSLDDLSPDADFSGVEKYFPEIFRRLVKNGRPHYGVYYNINFPKGGADAVKGVRVTSMGLSHWEKEFVRWDPEIFEKKKALAKFFGKAKQYTPEEGEELYMMMGQFVDHKDNIPDADHHFVREGYVSITPLTVYTSDPKEIRRLRRKHFDTDFQEPDKSE